MGALDLLDRAGIRLRHATQGNQMDKLRNAFEKHAEPENGRGCMIWRGPSNGTYGQTQVGGRAGKMWLAHRLSWTVHFGAIPAGMCVCHRCDEPLCVNPRHLFLGTVADNMADKVAKGRHRNGVTLGLKNKKSKLSPEKAREIRHLHAAGGTQRALAAQFGVTKTAIAQVLRGETWRDDDAREAA